MRSRPAVVGMMVLVLAACGAGDGSGMPSGDHVHSLGVTSDGDLLLGLHGGLYRSSDGEVWQLAGLSGEDAMVIAAAATDEPMFVAGHDVLYRSDDGGVTFSPLTPADLPGMDLHGFGQAPTNGQSVYAFVVGYGLFASRDAGETWELRAPIQSIPQDVFGLAVVGSGDETVVIMGPESGVLRSTDGGRNFIAVLDTPTGAVTVDREAPDTVWALTAAGLARSTDTGKTWEMASTLEGVEGQPVALAVEGAELWLVTEQPRVLYRSGDAGGTWDRIAGT